MEKFDEKVFLWSLTARPEDARTFATKFKADWLHRAEYRPIYNAIILFLKKQGLPPSVPTLHRIFEKEDPEAYNNRMKNVLTDLQKENPDVTEQIFTLEQASEVAIVRSFQEMQSQQSFLVKQENLKGHEVLQDVQRWLNLHIGVGEDKTFNIDEAVHHLITSQGFHEPITHIPVGIKPIDEWCGGGLRPRQLGIVVAPTGHGKSVSLIVMSQKVATIEELPVWYITNEISMDEATERFLARFTGINVGKIIKDPFCALPAWKKNWQGLIKDRLRISEINREISTADLEAEMVRWSNLYGWKPKVICLDYMERMRPNATGYSRDKEWSWIGAIARDLIRLAKRHNLLIWTAAQTNRGGLTAHKIDLTMLQGSIRHVEEATACIAMHKTYLRTTEDGEEEMGMTWFDLKQRHSKGSNKPITVKCNLDRMEITSDVVDIEEIDRSSDDDGKQTPRQKQQRKQKVQAAYKAMPGNK